MTEKGKKPQCLALRLALSSSLPEIPQSTVRTCVKRPLPVTAFTLRAPWAVGADLVTFGDNHQMPFSVSEAP